MIIVNLLLIDIRRIMIVGKFEKKEIMFLFVMVEIYLFFRFYKNL